MDYSNLSVGDVKGMVDRIATPDAGLTTRLKALGERHAAARAATDASIKSATPLNPFRAMKPTTAIVGAVAVGALAVGGIKLMQRRRDRAEQRSWTQRIEQERAVAARQPQGPSI